MKMFCLRSLVSASRAARCLLAEFSCSAGKDDKENYIFILKKTLFSEIIFIRKKWQVKQQDIHTSEISVEVVHPFDLSLQLVPHCLLQVLALGRALHKGLIGFRDSLNLQLQLGRERKCAWSFFGGGGFLFCHSFV